MPNVKDFFTFSIFLSLCVLSIHDTLFLNSLCCCHLTLLVMSLLPHIHVSSEPRNHSHLRNFPFFFFLVFVLLNPHAVTPFWGPLGWEGRWIWLDMVCAYAGQFQSPCLWWTFLALASGPACSLGSRSHVDCTSVSIHMQAAPSPPIFCLPLVLGLRPKIN